MSKRDVQIIDAWMEVFDAHRKVWGDGGKHRHILMTLHRSELVDAVGLHVAEVQRRTNYSYSTCKRTLERLVERELVERGDKGIYRTSGQFRRTKRGILDQIVKSWSAIIQAKNQDDSPR